MLDLNKLSLKSYSIAKEREKNGAVKADVMSILKHCAGEVTEATEAFCDWRNNADKESRIFNLQDLQSELADIINCVLIINGSLSEVVSTDLENALLSTIQRQEWRALGCGDKL